MLGYSYITILLHLVEQLLARLFEHLDYEVEALATFVVWVGHVVVCAAIGGEVVAHTINFIYMLARGSETANSFVVTVVHHHNSVEIVEVGRTEWTRAVRQAVAATVRSFAHSRVCQLASVARICTSRVDFELLRQTARKDLLAKNLLRHRRTADISQANEKYLLFHHLLSIIKKLH